MDDDFGDDGWGEDLDDLIADDDEVEGPPAPAPAPVPVPAPAPAAVSDAGLNNEEDGWDDGLDDLEDLDAEPSGEPPKNNNNNTAAAGAPAEPGWGNDDDLFQDSLEFEDTIAAAEVQTPPRQTNHQLDQVHKELVSYVESLMVLLPSINAVLAAEYNLPEKAADLLHYYSERPQLRQYTIEKELSRMDYQVHLQHASGEEPIIIDNKDEIGKLFKLQNELDLLVRCANQSLLADLLHVMTGPDGLVRPQYMATCLADSCMFVLRCMPGMPGGLVECTSRLVLSLPEPSGNRYPVANLKVLILLGVPSYPNQPPMVEFKLLTMDIILPSMDVLRPTAKFLLESGLLDDPCMSPFPASHAGAGPIDDNDTFRDIFLQQSQSMLQNSTIGLKSAWKQIDSVAGLQNKMNMVKNILPTTDTSMIEAAMQEQEAYQQELQAQQQHPPLSDMVPVSYLPYSGGSQPPTMPPHQPQARPTSILGSFMGRIAKSVALPEEDPSIYESYATELQKSHSAGSQSQGAFPLTQGSFPRPPAVSAPASDPPMKLYRTSDHSNKPPAPAPAPETAPAKHASPWLSRMAAPEVIPPASIPVPPAPKAALFVADSKPQNDEDKIKKDDDDDDDLGLDDGWGDDLGLDDDHPEETVLETAMPPAPHASVLRTSIPTTSQTIASSVSPKEEEKFTPEDDIVETRKRWVNPRPTPRYLTKVFS